MKKTTRPTMGFESLEGRSLMTATAITPNQVLVAEYYEVYLNRPVDPAGLATWSTMLDKGASPQAVGESIIHSAEYESGYVESDYEFYLDRTPTPAETNGWVAWLQKGHTTDELDAAFLASPE
jgi:hypothetical protein